LDLRVRILEGQAGSFDFGTRILTSGGLKSLSAGVNRATAAIYQNPFRWWRAEIGPCIKAGMNPAATDLPQSIK
jgi:hypothetical protein